MQHKKSKQNQLGKQKMLEAQHRNDYFRRMGNFCKLITGEDLLMLAPKHEFDLLYRHRPRIIIAEPEAGYEIPAVLLESIKISVKDWFKKIVITYESKVKVPLSDHFEFGVPLNVLVQLMKKTNYKNSEKIIDLLWDYFGDLDELARIVEEEIMYYVFPSLTILANDFNSGFYSFRLTLDYVKNEMRAGFKIKVKKIPQSVFHVNINNNSRPAFRVGWNDNNAEEVAWTDVSPAQLGIKSGADDPIPVYIQNHALQRLEERLDCIPLSFLQVNVYHALRNCKVVKEKGKLLIEYRICDVKVGYLSAIMIKGKLVIRTFLFLTCMETPEGRRLETFVGLKKLDCKYLKMDKLSSYMSAKLSTNKEIRDIFAKADCLHLVESFRNLDKISKIHPENSPLEMITGYLKTNDTDPNFWEFAEKLEKRDLVEV